MSAGSMFELCMGFVVQHTTLVLGGERYPGNRPDLFILLDMGIISIYGIETPVEILCPDSDHFKSRPCGLHFLTTVFMNF